MADKPIIYPRSESGCRPAADPDKWGPLGDIHAVTFHHSAGPRAPNKAKAEQLHRAYQLDHQNKGWGDIGYHYGIDDLGRIYELHDLRYKGTHVGEHNTGNVGFMLHGNYVHDKLTKDQNESLRWLFTGGFLELLGEREKHIALVRGHQEWPGHGTNACPGNHLMRRIRYLRNEEFH